MTSFLKSHPGGEGTILRSASRIDATNDFEAVGHSSGARKLLQKYRIGKFVEEDEHDNDVKIDIKTEEKKRSHHHHHHHHSSQSENIWLKDEPPGTKYIGKAGNRFNTICFIWTAAMAYMSPMEVDFDPEELQGLERVYWFPIKLDKDMKLKFRRHRFHAFNRPWLVALMSYLLITFGGFQLDSFGQVLNLVTVTLCMVAVLSVPMLARCQGLAVLPRLLFQIPILFCGVTFTSIVTLLMYIGMYGDLVTYRYSMLCITSAFLLLTFPSSYPKGMGGSWYFGKIQDRMEFAHSLILCSALEMGILSRGGGLFGIFLGMTFGLLVAYQNQLITVMIRVLRGRTGILSSSVAITSALLCSVFRFVFGIIMNTFSVPDLGTVFMKENEENVDITRCVFLLVFVALVQILLSNLVTVPSVDNATAAAHLQGMYGSFYLHVGTLVWLALCIIFGSSTLTYYLPAFVLTNVSLKFQHQYMSKLTKNSVNNFDKDPVGKNCSDMCDKEGPLTLKVGFITFSLTL